MLGCYPIGTTATGADFICHRLERSTGQTDRTASGKRIGQVEENILPQSSVDGVADATGCLRVVVSSAAMATAGAAEYRAGGYSALCDRFAAGCILQVSPLWPSIP